MKRGFFSVGGRRVLMGAGALALVAAGLSAPSTAKAGSPNPISVAPGAPGSYSGSVGPGWPDPNGPPAPSASCSSNANGVQPCDLETVNLGTGNAPANDVFTLSLAVTFTPSDPAGQNCLDIAIEDATQSQVYAHTSCTQTHVTNLTVADAAPGKAYTIEVDANGTDLAGLTPQPFSAAVTSTATQPGPMPTPTPVPANPFSFTHEVSVDVQRGDGEPDLAISSNNKDLYTATPWGFSTTVSLLWKSKDGGVQWDNLHGAALGDTPPCPDPVAVVLRPDCSRGGGDAEVQLSRPATSGAPQTVQFEDLNGLDSISCAYSTNGGDTFNDLVGYTVNGNPVPGSACDEGGTVPPQCQTFPPPQNSCGALGTDRQWVQVWPQGQQPTGGTADGAPLGQHDLLYMTFDTGDQPPSGDASIWSPDNGQHWEAGCTTITSSSCLGGANGVGSRPGPLVINPRRLNVVADHGDVVGGTYPTLYEFMGTNSNGSEVNISCDGGQSWSHVVTSTGLAGSTTNDFVAGAIDSSGELYTAFTVANDPNPWRVWFAHSTDRSGSTVGDCSVPVQGGKWSTPVALTGPPSTADGVGATPIPSQGYAVMPWLTAGSRGRVDLVYYGSTAPVPTSPDNQAEPWFLHMAQTLNGGTSWTDEQASETPMHTKSICFSGIGCTLQQPPGGDRNLLDFFQVKTDSHGRAIIIYTDDNNSAACAATCTEGIGLISEVQQATGPSLLASVGSVPPLASAGLGQSLDQRFAGSTAAITDPGGDALLAPPGHNLGASPADEVPAADITNLKVCLVKGPGCPVTNTSANTAAFLFKVKSLAGGPGSAVVATDGSTQANWLVTWRANNDLWFAEATSDPSGTLSCFYGRPLSVYNDGEPKAAEYLGPPENSEAQSTTGCTPNITKNTIEIDVPFNSVSGLSSASVLYGLTGWTGNSSAALPSSVCAAGGGVNCSGPIGFFSNIDETAPIDVSIAGPAANTPEVPATALLLGFGGAAMMGGAVFRGRRRRMAAATV